MREISSENRNWRVITGKNLVFFVLGVFLVFFLLRQIDMKELVHQITGVRLEFFLFGGGIYILKVCFRSLRMNRISAEIALPYWRTLRLSLATSLATQIFPFKLGELSYVYLLNREKSTSSAQGLSALIVIRMMDLLAIGMLYLVVVLSLHSPQSGMQSRQALLFLGLLGGSFGVLFFVSHMSLKFLYRERQKFFNEGKSFSRLLDWLGRFFVAFMTYRPEQIALWMGLALLEWMANYVIFYLLLWGMGAPINPFQTITAVTFAAIASALPVNMVGSFGSQEAGWTAGLLMVHVDQQIAITTAFSTHILTLGYIAFFGILAWISYLLSAGVNLRPE